MHSHSKSNTLQSIPLLPPLGAGQMMCLLLIITEAHNGGIALHRLKTTPVFVKGMRFRELVPGLHSTAVITARYQRNVKLQMPKNRQKTLEASSWIATVMDDH